MRRWLVGVSGGREGRIPGPVLCLCPELRLKLRLGIGSAVTDLLVVVVIGAVIRGRMVAASAGGGAAIGGAGGEGPTEGVQGGFRGWGGRAGGGRVLLWGSGCAPLGLCGARRE